MFEAKTAKRHIHFGMTMALQLAAFAKVTWTGELCPEGVAVLDAPSASPDASRSPWYGTVNLGRHFAYRSDARTLCRREIANLEDPLALRFLNARGEDQLAKFFGRFGMMFPNIPMSVEDVYDRRARLIDAALRLLHQSTEVREATLELANDAMAKTPARTLISVDASGRPVLEVACGSLWQFMFLELVIASTLGAALHICESCGTKFLVGPRTNRRGTARHCSDKCRVASFRGRKKGLSRS